MPLTPGTRLGSYEIVSRLGSGGMGEVYKAKDLKLGRDVAIKVLREDLASDPERLRRFEQEARAASSLNHPNIVTIHDIGEHEGTRYIAMEYVEGKTLREILTGEPLPAKKLLKLSTQIADGLAKAHAAGIVHRDLKPENLMVTGDGFVKILDFGLAKLMPEPSEVDPEMATKSKETREGVVLGTVQYMSPEQAAGRPVDYHSDQFSLGSILYEMATGKLAFQRETAPETQAAIMRDEPEPITVLNPHVPAQLTHIIGRCLEKELQDRYDSTRDLARELEGIDELTTAPHAPSPSSRRMPLTGIVGAGLGAILLAMAAAMFSGDIQKWIAGDVGRPQIESIAVLPLENLSGDPEQEYFADGMTEALIADLAKISALRVISRQSVMQFKESDEPLPNIAAALDVDAVLEGSVLRSGDRVRITTQLIQASPERHLWSESYERTVRDAISLQSEVATTIAAAIEVALTPEEQRRLAASRTVNPKAQEAYLKGRYYHLRYETAEQSKALRYFEQAVAIDPNYAPAYAGLAQGYWDQALLTPPGEAREAILSKIRASIEKALELDNELAEAYSERGWLRAFWDFDWRGAESDFQRAIRLNPSLPKAHQGYAFYLTGMGRVQESVAEILRMVELDPVTSGYLAASQWPFFCARRYDDAIRQLEQAMDLDPDYGPTYTYLGMAYAEKGMYEESIAAFTKALAQGTTLASTVKGHIAYTYGIAGKTEEARRALHDLHELSKAQYVDPTMFAIAHASLGENEQAFEFLEQAYMDRDNFITYLRVLPQLDLLRHDPRFQDLVKRMNFPE